MPSLPPPQPATITTMSGKTWPPKPFPTDLECHPLLIVDYSEIMNGSKEELDKLYKACTSIGFFYLSNHGIESEPMFEMGEATFALPQDELDSFEQGDSGMSAGYKKAGLNNVDAKGNVDTVHFINIAKDDALHYPEVRQRTYPRTCVERMATITDFHERSNQVLLNIMAALEPTIGLPAGTLAKLHPRDQLSGSESRVISKPAEGERGHIPEGDGGKAAAIGAHTDFGSLSMLHGRGTGGLQVLVPGASEWAWIRPIPGHCVVNVGDTLSVFSGGIFRSNIHRVVTPPSPQNTFTRYSLVFFLRPFFDAPLEPLSNLSAIIKDAADKNEAIQSMEKGATAGSWYKRRISKQRVANRKGPETWGESRGTEHNPTRD
ncbi:Clavaminate synthase-like protein [Meredithblackwellia eburnea MCA 4105]